MDSPHELSECEINYIFSLIIDEISDDVSIIESEFVGASVLFRDFSPSLVQRGDKE